MPLYDFHCPACKKTEELYVYSYQSKPPCPDCKVEMEKLPSYFHIRCSARIPKNHLPKSKGGDFDGKDAYWQGTESRYR